MFQSLTFDFIKVKRSWKFKYWAIDYVGVQIGVQSIENSNTLKYTYKAHGLFKTS